MTQSVHEDRIVHSHDALFRLKRGTNGLGERKDPAIGLAIEETRRERIRREFGAEVTVHNVFALH